MGYMPKKYFKMFSNPASRARMQYFLNDDSSNKYSCETIGKEASHSKVPDWKCGEGL